MSEEHDRAAYMAVFAIYDWAREQRDSTARRLADAKREVARAQEKAEEASRHLVNARVALQAVVDEAGMSCLQEHGGLVLLFKDKGEQVRIRVPASLSDAMTKLLKTREMA